MLRRRRSKIPFLYAYRHVRGLFRVEKRLRAYLACRSSRLCFPPREEQAGRLTPDCLLHRDALASNEGYATQKDCSVPALHAGVMTRCLQHCFTKSIRTCKHLGRYSHVASRSENVRRTRGEITDLRDCLQSPPRPSSVFIRVPRSRHESLGTNPQ